MLHFTNTPTIRLVPLHFPPSSHQLFAGIAGAFNAARRLIRSDMHSYQQFVQSYPERVCEHSWCYHLVTTIFCDPPRLAHMVCRSGGTSLSSSGRNVNCDHANTVFLQFTNFAQATFIYHQLTNDRTRQKLFLHQRT